MRIAIGIAALALIACEQPVEHQLIVDLRTDFTPVLEFDRVEVLAYDTAAIETVIANHDEPARADADYEDGARIATLRLPGPGTHRARVRLWLGDRVRAETAVHVVVERTTVVLVLLGRSCEALRCPEAGGDPAAVTCIGGRCVLPACAAPMPDPTCGTPECALDTDCAPTSACSVPRCEAGACFRFGDDARCAPGEVCSSELGCVARATDAGPIGADAGPPCDPPCASDGDACTDELCVEGACVEAPVSCDDGNPCTDDSCSPSTGCRNLEAPRRPCEDGDPCTLDDECDNGVCDGRPRSCDDDNPCTHDTCTPGIGCTFTGDTMLGCDDGAYCNGDEACLADGRCRAGTARCTTIPGRACDERERRCVTCGGMGQPCCTGDTCNAGSECRFGSCRACIGPCG